MNENDYNHKKTFWNVFNKLMLAFGFLCFFISTIALLEIYIDICLFAILSLSLLLYFTYFNTKVLVLFTLIIFISILLNDIIRIDNDFLIIEFVGIVISFLVCLKISKDSIDKYINTVFVTFFCMSLNIYVNIFIFSGRMGFNFLSDMVFLYFNFLLGGYIFLMKFICFFNEKFYLERSDIRIISFFIIKNMFFLMILYIL